MEKLTNLWYKIKLIVLIIKSKRVILLTQNKQQIKNDTHRNVAIGFHYVEQITELLEASYLSINAQEDALDEVKQILNN
jgi:hypothetical protein